MAGAGFTAADFADDDPVSIWPDCRDAFLLLYRLRTQWRVGGIGGASGLDYQVAFRLMDQDGVTGEAWSALLEDLQVLEQAALDAMAEARSGDE